MSFTATGVAPTSLNLNMFEKEEVKPKSPVLTDDEEIFSLDMVTMDMEFDRAYSMYTQMQQKHALSGVEQLQKAKQAREGQMVSAQQQHGDVTSSHPPHGSHHHASQATQSHAATQSHHHHFTSPYANNTNSNFYDYSQTPYDSGVPGLPLLSPPSESGGLFSGSKTANPLAKPAEDEMDHFFLNTESSALEKFLDNLASSSSGNPLELYSAGSPKLAANSSIYDNMHTMDPIKPPQQQHQRQQLSDDVKKDVTDAFRHPPVQSLKSFGTKEHQLHTQEEIRQQQLPTPLDSRQSSSSEKRRLSEESSSSGSGNGDWSSPKKRRRSSTRPLLTLEQKRLNHSHSEQKRRLLCKQAYERCLRLITNVEDYKNDLVSASAVTSSKKKSKRKQINKDGLPNLSKHTALLKVSAEILKIRGKNEKLRELLSQ
ncbi:hypothetical protein ACI3LY_001924 [Candidozyma auris]|uniref:BHLH domain-containing protein n=2 Tax=Candidozyma auris TaxID=498019 RepID=A0A2H0ZL50_CANAR|nr:hypothetical protein QG37_07243 [[Candida] auris]PIS51043.1 hypothetical protein B9J08_002613 [[Candida] auris]QWW22497.1 hypothetical protein CA7LBN_001243 [[Candida] auris]